MEIKGKVLHLLSVPPVQCLGNAEQGGELEHGDAAFPVLPGKMRQVSWRGFAPVSVGDLGNHVYLVPAQPEDVRVADDVAALGDTYATDAELASAIESEVTRANGAYAAKSLETTVANLSTAVDGKAAQSDVDTISGKVGTLETDMAQAKEDIDAVELLAAANKSAHEANAAAIALKASQADLEAVSGRVATLETWHENFVECSQEDINGLFTA